MNKFFCESFDARRYTAITDAAPTYEPCPCFPACTEMETPPIPCVCAAMYGTDAALNYLRLADVRKLATGWLMAVPSHGCGTQMRTRHNCGVAILALLDGEANDELG